MSSAFAALMARAATGEASGGEVMQALTARAMEDPELERLMPGAYFGVDQDPRDTTFALLRAFTAEIGGLGDLFKIRTASTFTGLDGAPCQFVAEEEGEQSYLLFDTQRLRAAFDFDFEEAVISAEELMRRRPCSACRRTHDVIRHGYVAVWPQLLLIVHERIDLRRREQWPKSFRFDGRNGEPVRYEMRSYVVRTGRQAATGGHCFTVVRTDDGLIVHNDWRKPRATREPDEICDHIRFAYYEKVDADFDLPDVEPETE